MKSKLLATLFADPAEPSYRYRYYALPPPPARLPSAPSVRHATLYRSSIGRSRAPAEYVSPRTLAVIAR